MTEHWGLLIFADLGKRIRKKKEENRMKLTLEGIKEKKDWESAGVKLPSYDIDTIVARTKESPEWVHFGA